MRELKARLRFLQPCYGDVRSEQGTQVVFRMPRDSKGRVLFAPTWWRAITLFAAKGLNLPQAVVRNVSWDPVVSGPVSELRRYLREAPEPGRRKRYAIHEAFAIDAVIEIGLMAPRELSDAQLRDLLNTAGKYRGISPYKPGQFGNFEVIDLSAVAEEQAEQ